MCTTVDSDPTARRTLRRSDLTSKQREAATTTVRSKLAVAAFREGPEVRPASPTAGQILSQWESARKLLAVADNVSETAGEPV